MFLSSSLLEENRKKALLSWLMGETCIQHYSKSSLLYAFWYLLPHAFSTHFYASFNDQLLTNVYQSIAISFSVYDFSHFFFLISTTF